MDAFVRQLYRAIDVADVAGVKRLLATAPQGFTLNINEDSHELTPLIRACMCDNVDMVNVLLAHGASATVNDCHDSSPLAYGRSTQVVESLLAAGANINHVGKRGVYPLLNAIRRGQVDVINLLMQRGAHVGSGGVLMCGAIMNQHVATLEFLLKAGIHIDAVIDGTVVNVGSCKTALHVAVWQRRPESVKMVLAYNPDVNSVDYNHRTALMATFNHIANSGVSVPSRYINMCNLLIEHGANVNAYNVLDSVLGLAGQSCDLEYVRTLLHAGADASFELARVDDSHANMHLNSASRQVAAKYKLTLPYLGVLRQLVAKYPRPVLEPLTLMDTVCSYLRRYPAMCSGLDEVVPSQFLTHMTVQSDPLSTTLSHVLPQELIERLARVPRRHTTAEYRQYVDSLFRPIP